MIKTDDDEWLETVLYGYDILEELECEGKVPRSLYKELKWYRNSYRCSVDVTEEWHPTVEPHVAKKKRVAVNRRYSREVGIIDITEMHLDKIGPTACVMHELTHQCTGTELDAEVIEYFVAQKAREKYLITSSELALFTLRPRGRFYHLSPTRSGRFYYKKWELWP
jgi:hypothetical protein